MRAFFVVLANDSSSPRLTLEAAEYAAENMIRKGMRDVVILYMPEGT